MNDSPMRRSFTFLLACLAIPACAPPRGVVTYEEIELTGRPRFADFGDEGAADRYMSMRIEEPSPAFDSSVLWDNQVLRSSRTDPARRYRFKILEGSYLSYEGTRNRTCEMWQAYDHRQRLVYDASFCRVHRRTMQRESSQETAPAEDLPRAFDAAKARSFPNSRFTHPACSSSIYQGLDWICPECSDAETTWLEKHSPPETAGRAVR